MVKGVLKKGSSISVKYTSNASSKGVTYVMIGAVPPEACIPPGSRNLSVAPAASETHTFKLMDTAEMLRIFVTIPKDGGSGTLTVTENDVIHDEEIINSNTSWTYSVE